MASNPVHKVIITGTGRSGTTLLMQLLTGLGLDTGYADIHEEIIDSCHAGMEQSLFEPMAPYIVKSPYLCTQLEDLLATGKFVIDHAFIPIRNLHDAAASRISVWKKQTARTEKTGITEEPPPGGLFGCYFPHQQVNALARAFYQLMYTVTAYEIPHTLIEFPRFAHDPQYLYNRLQPIVSPADYHKLFKTFERVVEPSLIHTFDHDVFEAA